MIPGSSCDAGRAMAAGLTPRPLRSETIRETLDHERAQPTPGNQGLSREREAEVLKAWRRPVTVNGNVSFWYSALGIPGLRPATLTGPTGRRRLHRGCGIHRSLDGVLPQASRPDASRRGP